MITYTCTDYKETHKEAIAADEDFDNVAVGFIEYDDVQMKIVYSSNDELITGFLLRSDTPIEEVFDDECKRVLSACDHELTGEIDGEGWHIIFYFQSEEVLEEVIEYLLLDRLGGYVQVRDAA